MKQLFKIWFPSASSLFLLGIEIPIITLFVSKYNSGYSLTIFGISLSIIIAFNGTVVSIASAVISLGDSVEHLRKIKKYTFLWCVIVSCSYALCFFSPFQSIVFTWIFNVDEVIVGTLQNTLLAFFPSIFFVAWRRYQQGILIKFKKTKTIFYATLCRLFVSLVVVIFLNSLALMNSATAGAIALTVGAFIEALVLYIYTKIININLSTRHNPKIILNWRVFYRFYSPLAVSTCIPLSYGLIISSGLSHSIDSQLSLEVWPTLFVLVGLMLNLTTDVENIVIPFWQEPNNLKPIMLFCQLCGLMLSFLLLLVFFYKPLFDLYFSFAMGLENNALNFIGGYHMILLGILPFLYIFKSAIRGLALYLKNTSLIQTSVLFSTCIFIGFLALSNYLQMKGLSIASIAYCLVVLSELVFLLSHRTIISKFSTR